MAVDTQELFKFSWTIENVTAWDFNRSIESPCFVVEELANASFYLEWNGKGKTNGNSSLYLTRKKLDGAPEIIKLQFSFKMPHQSWARKSRENVLLRLSRSWGWSNCIANSIILKNDKWLLLSGDLHIECTILKPGISDNLPLGNAPKGFYGCVQCSARTRLKTETVSVKWKIGNFSSLRPGEKVTIWIFFPSEDSPRFLATLCLNEKSSELVQMDINNLKSLEADPTFVALKVTFGEKEKTEIVKIDTHVFDSKNINTIWSPVSIRKSELADGNKRIIRSDVLPILLEFKIDSGVEHSRIDKTAYTLVSRGGDHTCKGCSNNGELSKMKQSLLMFLRDQKLCDIHLETPTKTIGAHKTILCGNSPVFSAMFEHDTLEKETRTIQVTVVSFESLERFLRCLYAERLDDDVGVREATELFTAADYYQVDFLKDECLQFLKDRLQVENVCHVLSLADRHKDEDLMDSVRDFIARSRRQVLDSEGWKALLGESPNLAIEVLQWLCVN